VQGADDLVAQRTPLGLGAGVQKRDAAGQMIEYQQRRGRDVMHRGHRIQDRAARRQALEESHDIVRSVTDESACERHAGNVGQRPRRARKSPAQDVEKLGPAVGQGLGLSTDRDPACRNLELKTIPEADERVTREPLASLDALQEKARIQGGELHERRNRRIKITPDVERWLQN